jgi:hypothetical protein
MQRNTEGCSYNHSCSGQAISNTYSEWVFVALGIQHAMRMRHTDMCGLCVSTVYFHIISYTERLKNPNLTQNTCFDISHIFFF